MTLFFAFLPSEGGQFSCVPWTNKEINKAKKEKLTLLHKSDKGAGYSHTPV